MDYLTSKSQIKRSLVVARIEATQRIPSRIKSYERESNIKIKEFSFEKIKILNC